VDSAPDPLALDLDYGSVGGVGGGGGAGGAPAGPPNMGFVEVNGHRGLRWSIADQSGKASAVVGGTKILGIDGATAATIEAVVAVEGGLPGTVCERIAHIGTNSNGSLTLCSEDGQRLDLRVNTMNGPFWSVGLPSLGRVVVHVVLDSSEALAPDRAKLYLDGALVPASGGTPIPPGLTVALTFGEYAIGNRVDSAASQQGTIFYLAHYLTALTEQEVVNNAQVLAVSDDHP
ncbi:MAG: hypothetical protein KC731_13675, partial [Myxococcales bacterium]|nr:hypothetical protein [Myxococcales bacterium]